MLRVTRNRIFVTIATLVVSLPLIVVAISTFSPHSKGHAGKLDNSWHQSEHTSCMIDLSSRIFSCPTADEEIVFGHSPMITHN
jgi:hypothetical protein